ncbi:filamentous hemagglutinin family protein [Altererythrobacter sp. N1]|nr:filamentous hemagglutinin family protein [Altererythrobacter sp. N1]
MTAKAPSLRTKLLIGASIGSLLLSGVAAAQDRSGGRIANGRGGVDPAAAVARAAQQQAARAAETNSASRRAVEAFRRAAETRQQMFDAQAAARAAAQAAQSNVPNGLGEGGLQVANGVELDPSLWIGAEGPVQSQGEDGRTNVSIDQTEQKAILTWDSFNVGRETDLAFNQGGADWVALNRVTGASADPSQILGSIKAEGTLLILNQNGIIFGGASQVNVRNLVASTADITNDAFLESGIYSNLAGQNYVPSFTDAVGAVTVEAGAQIETNAPESVTAGGGYVLLMGTEVTNEGTITTPMGQALLAAGDDFIVRQGYGTESNSSSTTRGNEVRGFIDEESTSGTVVNAGLIEAQQGDITLTGRTIRQDGVAIATTSVNQRGTIHLLNSASDEQGSVTLGADSLTTVMPELESEDTALNSRRDDLVQRSELANQARRQALAEGDFDNLSVLEDRLDLSRIEIVTGGNVLFEGGSQTRAQGGQVAVQALGVDEAADGTINGRITVEDGALVDVSGVQGVALDMESNSILVNIQGNELRDSPQNRENDGLRNNDVWIDVRDLVLLPDGTGGYEGDRWYTAGGLLEVGGYLGNMEHGIGEWTAIGGTIALAAKEVIAQEGAVFDISGGSLDYQAGWVRSSRIMGADGKLYDIGRAPAGMEMIAYGNAFTQKHERWGEAYTEVYSHPLFSSRSYARWEDGYSVGRDAGRLILSAPTVLMEGEVVAEVINGEWQTKGRADGITDGYDVGAHTVAKAGALIIGGNAALGAVGHTYETDIRVSDFADLGSTLTESGLVADDRANTVWLDADYLNTLNLGGLELNTRSTLSIDSAISVADGGDVVLRGGNVDINADITARSGNVLATNITQAARFDTSAYLPATVDGRSRIALRDGATIDARGVWSNQFQDGDSASRAAYVDGGTVILESTDIVLVEEGSLIDVSSGAALRVDRSLAGGRGGDVTLRTGMAAGGVRNNFEANTILDGEIRGYGVAGAGTLTVQSGGALSIGGELLENNGTLGTGETTSVTLLLQEDVELLAGDVLTFDYSFTRTHVQPGETFGEAQIRLTGLAEEDYVTLASDWTLPATATYAVSVRYYDPSGAGQFVSVPPGASSFPTIPAGSRIYYMLVPQGAWTDYTLPTNVFTQGLEMYGSIRTTYEAGVPLVIDVTIPAGTLLPAGATFNRDVAVKDTQQVAPDVFDNGFADYVVIGQHGLAVLDDTAFDVHMPVLRATAGMLNISSGSDPLDALELWTPPLYMADVKTGTLAQRGGASLTLSTVRSDTNMGIAGPISIGTGASVSVDPGESISLISGQSVDVDGHLTARGGLIDIRSMGDGLDAGIAQTANRIRENAVLDVSGDSFVATDVQGGRFGLVRDGGTVNIGVNNRGQNPNTNLYGVSTLPVVVEEGALIDLSGASATLDLYPDRPGVEVAGNGGTLALASRKAIVLDGAVDAHAGGANAYGGTLDIMLEGGFEAGLIDPDHPAMRIVTISQEKGGPADTEDLASFHSGMELAVDQIEQSGFESLSIWARDAIRFKGNVNLEMGRSLSLEQGLLTLDRETLDSTVRVAAPYLRLVGHSSTPIPPSSDSGTTGSYFAGVMITDVAGSALTGSDSRFLAEADLIDIEDGATIFGHSFERSVGPGSNDTVLEDLPGFATVELNSSGDIRFTDGALVSERELILTSQRLYPTTHASGLIQVGVGPEGTRGDPVEGAIIRFRHAGSGDVETPHSVFGNLYLLAPEVEQGGAIFAPLGHIEYSDAPNIRDGSVRPSYLFRPERMEMTLLDGSITSVSAKGLTLPYGYTTDGLSYYYDGEEAEFDYIGNNETYQRDRTNGGIFLKATTFTAEEGAVIDMSGGGTLQGAGFRSGRGGSTDVRYNPLGDSNPFYGSSDGHDVYAIVPGYADGYAPIAPTSDGGAIGKQISIGDDVPGLPAGTYTLLPAEYALMPGGFRVELGNELPRVSSVTSTSAGITRTTARIGDALSGVTDPRSREVLVMAADTLRTHGNYNEMTLTEWVFSEMARYGNPRLINAMLPDDVRPLHFDAALRGWSSDYSGEVFNFEGTLLNDAGEKGFGGLVHFSGGPFEVLGEDGEASDDWLTLRDSDLNNLDATVLGLGIAGINELGISASGSVTVRSGAELKAGTVMLAGGDGAGLSNVLAPVTIEDGASIDTRGMGEAGWTLENGFLLSLFNADRSLVVISNDTMTFGAVEGAGRVVIEDNASLQGEGTVGLLGPGGLDLGEVNITAGDLLLAVEDINIGEDAALADAAAAGVLSEGWQLNQTILDGLLHSSEGGFDSLRLQATNSINLIGDVTLDTFDAETGESTTSITLVTPAIYGLGNDGDTATIRTDRFVWSGLGIESGRLGSTDYVLESAAPGDVIAGGAGTGSGGFHVDANEVLFGFTGQPGDLTANLKLERLMLGFGDVEFAASEQVTAQQLGTLSVYQKKLADGSFAGGDLTLTAPVLTGTAGSEMDYAAGDALMIRRPENAAEVDMSALDLGATLRLAGDNLTVSGLVAAPSGLVEVKADGDIILTETATLDLSGQPVEFFEETRHSFGGNLLLESASGSILQREGSVIDVSADYSDSGAIQAITDSGRVDLAGTLLAGHNPVEGDESTGDYRGGTLRVRAGEIVGFTALNQRLNETGFDYLRSFETSTGDLTIGGELQAQHIAVTTNGGDLTVNGTLRGGGRYAGSIRLAARGDLVLSDGALLDASGDELRLDSDGGINEGVNRAIVDLTSAEGRVRIGNSAGFDVSAGGEALGTVDINVRRLGGARGNDVALDAGSNLTIAGAKRVAVNGMWTYDDAPVDPDNADGQLVTQAYLDRLHGDSTAFVDAALANGALQSRLSGLKSAAGDAYQLRPGLEIISTDPDGDLRVDGDLDFADYRYGAGVDPAVRGSGVAGVISLRAGGDLIVNGNISDGFDTPPITPDDVYEYNISGRLSSTFVVPHDMILAAGWSFGNGSRQAGFTLPFDINPTAPFSIDRSAVIPVDVTLNRSAYFTDVTTTATIILPEPVTDTQTGITYQGEIPAGTTLGQIIAPVGTQLKVGSVAYNSITVEPVPLPAGTLLTGMNVTRAEEFNQTFTLPKGVTLPSNFTTRTLVSAEPVEQKVWALSPMLAAGSESWNIRLVAGAELGSVDPRALSPDAAMGDLVLDNPSLVSTQYGVDLDTPEAISVIRTGTGDLELLAARDYRQNSRFGVYTAGTYVDNADTREGGALNLPRAILPDGTILAEVNAGYEDAIADYRSWFTTGGGNVTIEAGRDIFGHDYETPAGDWLWRQGAPEQGIQTAWWVNFGTYGLGRDSRNGSINTRNLSRIEAAMFGFDAIGTLGGGNLSVTAGRDMGAYQYDPSTGTQGLLSLAVASSGWVGADGTVHRTGGGDLTVNVGRQFNPVESRSADGGSVINLRGNIDITAGSIGTLWNTYDVDNQLSDYDPRPDSLSLHLPHEKRGVLDIFPGDGVTDVKTLGDMTLSVFDPGLQNSPGVVGTRVDGQNGTVLSWFSQYTDSTRIDLFSTGGDIGFDRNSGTPDLPGLVSAIAADGNIYGAAVRPGSGSDPVTVRPSTQGEIEFLAGDSIYYLDLITSAAPASILATLDSPAWAILPESQSADTGTLLAANTSGGLRYLDVYARGVNEPIARTQKVDPVLLYARDGDIAFINFGNVDTDSRTGSSSYYSGFPAYVRAGRDIVRFGQAAVTLSSGVYRQNSSLFFHSFEDDVSIIEAGRDLIHINAMVAGPGTLEVSAGGSLYQDDRGTIRSIGLIGANASSAPTGGADIAIMVGTGVEGADWVGVRDTYLDPANLADPERPLADQEGMVAKVYSEELVEWLTDRYANDADQFSGSDEAALAYFDALAPEHQRIFLRDIYYAELKIGGREYSGKIESGRFNSYLRGRQMAETLFPGVDSEEGTSPYDGDVVMFSTGTSAGMLRTEYGGDIQILAPGGDVTIGVDAVRPENGNNGILTQGTGNVQIYSQGDIALGLSRIFTTFGGDIFGWSAAGDINAGRGAKTTVLYTPPRRVYDDIGNVVLSPQIPSTGAGIATLAPLPEIPSGDVDLIAPLGVIDAGEAGIRVSGDINLAALQVLNAANIQVEGEATGIPVVAAVNTGALTAASSASSAVAAQAADLAERSRPQTRTEIPTILNVRFLGFGE